MNLASMSCPSTSTVGKKTSNLSCPLASFEIASSIVLKVVSE